MISGEVHAWNILNRQPVIVRWDNGTFTEITPTNEKPAQNKWIGPPLVDLQINGFAGIDFQKDKLSVEQLMHATSALENSGCSKFFFTLITSEWDIMTERLAKAKELRDKHTKLQQAIAGWHIEGPFLSSETGYCGAHPPNLMLAPTIARLTKIREITGKDPVLLTMAPEIEGGLPAFFKARELGFQVSIGHTNAPDNIIRRVTTGGSTGFTHLGNGCPAELRRDDNILWRALDNASLTYSLIPDRWHVSPALFRIIHRLINNNSIYYTTDAMAAAGSGPGKYQFGHLELEVGKEEIVRLPGTANLAGSALTPINCIRYASEMLRCDWQDTWKNYSTIPAEFMNLTTGFKIGAPAEFVEVETKSNNNINKINLHRY
ncbi:MAG: N-acetylglucosamine-6-phosphate deacetylase [Verrucomicrobiota bacterium]|nr:N-acetylglucosamine-6-phosphate deacetylase [Verrucomicrobiota bacterium]